jgi:hypothetical protein
MFCAEGLQACHTSHGPSGPADSIPKKEVPGISFFIYFFIIFKIRKPLVLIFLWATSAN